MRTIVVAVVDRQTDPPDNRNGGQSARRETECEPLGLVIDVPVSGLASLDIVRRFASNDVDSPYMTIVLHDTSDDLEVLDHRSPVLGARHPATRLMTAGTPAVLALLAGLLAKQTKAQSEGGHVCGMTPRQQQVLRLLVDGKTNREMAAELNVSEDTVKRHVEAVISKIGAVNRTHAAAQAVRMGLVD